MPTAPSVKKKDKKEKRLRVVVSAVAALKPSSGAEVEFEVCISHDTIEGTSFVFTNKSDSSVADVLRFFISDASQLPAVLKKLIVNKFHITYRPGADDSQFSLGLYTTFLLRAPAGPPNPDDAFKTTLFYSSGKKLSEITATLVYRQHHFGLQFVSQEFKTKNDYIIGSYHLQKEATLTDLAGLIFAPADLKTFSLPEIKFSDLRILFIKGTAEKAEKSAYAMGFGIKFDAKKLLMNLPVVGEVAAKFIPFDITELLLVYTIMPNEANEKLFDTTEEVSFIFKDKLNIKSPEMDIKAIGSGLNIFTDLRVGSLPDMGNALKLLPVKAATPAKKGNAKNGGTNSIAPANQAAPATTLPNAQPVVLPEAKPVTKKVVDGVTWKDVDFSKWGLEIKRVGYKADAANKKLSVFVDAGISLSFLALQVRGLGLLFELSNAFKTMPEVTFQGIGFMVRKGPIEIGGAFLETIVDLTKHDAQGKPILPELKVKMYNGAIIIKIFKFRIAGIGSYARYTVNNEVKTSLFVYAAFNGPLGGDPAFFVTGIAAGFGYNRTVRIPPVEKVRDFPLVSLVMDPETDPAKAKTPMMILDELVAQNAIPISEGDCWMALGIKFTTYEMLETFVLLIILFGKRLEFVIMGLAVLKLPKGLDAVQVAQIELVIIARFSPDSDLVSIQGMITPSSWIFSKDCKLSGGFAVYTWVSGPHAGDFVMTVGGYHPRFKKPAHYPVVDRLALTWQVTKEVSIRGEMYFALTSIAIMAGGKWQLSYNGSNIQASLVIWADMLIQWAPFYYEVEVGVTIKISADIDLFLISFSGSAELTAMIRIWGPPFAGRAFVNWSVISFDINFGDQKGLPPAKLKLHEFCKTFLPGTKLLNAVTLVDPVKITLEEGILQEIKVTKNADGTTQTQTVYLVGGGNLKIKLDSLLPLTTGESGITLPYTETDALGLLPMGKKELATHLYFTIVFEGKVLAGYNFAALKISEALEYAGGVLQNAPDAAAKTISQDTFKCSHFGKQVPAALWANTPGDEKDKNPKEPKLLKTIGGIYLELNKRRHNVERFPLDKSQIKKDTAVNIEKLETKNARALTRDDEQKIWADVKDNAKTDALFLTAMKELGIVLNAEDSTNGMNNKMAWKDSLQAEPAICLIDQIPVYYAGE